MEKCKQSNKKLLVLLIFSPMAELDSEIDKIVSKGDGINSQKLFNQFDFGIPYFEFERYLAYLFFNSIVFDGYSRTYSTKNYSYLYLPDSRFREKLSARFSVAPSIVKKACFSYGDVIDVFVMKNMIILSKNTQKKSKVQYKVNKDLRIRVVYSVIVEANLHGLKLIAEAKDNLIIISEK